MGIQIALTGLVMIVAALFVAFICQAGGIKSSNSPFWVKAFTVFTFIAGGILTIFGALVAIWSF